MYASNICEDGVPGLPPSETLVTGPSPPFLPSTPYRRWHRHLLCNPQPGLKLQSASNPTHLGPLYHP